MEDTEIRFESMPDFSSNPPTEEREYYSLFDELDEKCNPDRFMNPFVQKRFDLANELYAELQRRGKRDDYSLTDIRDKAIDGLGIHISTSRLYKHLLEYCDPKIYTAMKPYDKERVQEAGRLYAMIQEAKDDIHRLEAIGEEAASFIEIREQEIMQKEREENMRLLEEQKKQKEDEKDQRRASIILVIVIVVLIIVIIAKIEGN